MRLGLLIYTACASLLGAQSAMAQPEDATPCIPAAILTGNGEIVEELQSKLLLLGISSTAQDDCPVAHAQVSQDAQGVSVFLRAPSGRSASITLGDNRVMATWIDSWLQEELGASLLAVRQPLQSDTPPAQSPKPVKLRLRSPPASDYPADNWRLALSYESVVAGGEDWRSLRADSCVVLGPTCLGIAAIASLKNDRILTDSLAAYSQYSLGALLQVKAPVSMGKSTVSPYFGAGASWLLTQHLAVDDDCGDDDGQPECPLGPGSQGQSRSSLAPQAELGVELAVPLSPAWSLQLGVGINYRPFGKDARFEREAGVDASCLPSEPECVEALILTTPADPSRFWKLNLGIAAQL